jgi:putative ABC transport system permease protein
MLPLRLMPIAWKQVARHRTRTLLTASGVAIAVFLYCGIEALQSGAAAVTRASGGEVRLVVYRKDRYCPYTSRLPESYRSRIERVAGVASVVPVKIVISNCKTSLDVVTFRGVPGDDFIAEYLPHVRVVSGSIDDWKRRSDSVLLGETLAARRGLKPGDRFEAAGIKVYVAGVIASDEPQHRNVAYAHLSFLQFASGGRQGGFVTQFNVRVSDPRRLEEVARAIDDEFRTDQEPTQTRPETAFAAGAAADILEIAAFARWLAWGCLAAVAALVGNAIVLAVQGRIREHAVLQTLGFSGSLLARLILVEGIIVGLAGGLVGCVAAAAFLRWGEFNISTEGVSIPLEAGAMVFVGGIGLCVLLAAAAGLVPAVQAARREIVECFRAV